MKTKKRKIILLSCVIASAIIGAVGSFFAFGGAGILNGDAVATISNGVFDATPTDGENSRTITLGSLTLSGTNTHITVNSSTEVVLYNCTISGSSSHAIVVNGGTLSFDGGTTVSGCSGQCAVQVSGGTFNMDTGEIYNNNFGGVYVASGAIFNFSGGEIHNNGNSQHAEIAGVYNAGTMSMSGGEIYNNTTYHSNNGGGIYSTGSLTLSGGKIYGNNADRGAGVRVAGGTFSMTGGQIYSNNSLNYGGGIYSTGSLTLSGGKIYGNTADTGGGVCVGDGTFSMTGGQIYGNTASNGAEIATSGSGTEVSITGGTISPTAPSGNSMRADVDIYSPQSNENSFDYILSETLYIPSYNNSNIVSEESEKYIN